MLIEDKLKEILSNWDDIQTYNDDDISLIELTEEEIDMLQTDKISFYLY